MARALHAHYSRAAASTSESAWGDLPESIRQANCNAADHCLAKMHSLGFEVDAVPPGVLPKLLVGDAEELSRDEGALADLFAAVVRLEHERWTLERRFDGWVAGEHRDDNRRIHPLLVPWDVLIERFPEHVLKSRDQIKAMISCLAANGDADHVLSRRVTTLVAETDRAAPASLATNADAA